jgi:hypothetical protein
LGRGWSDNAARCQTTSTLAFEAGQSGLGLAANDAIPISARTLAYRPRAVLPMDPAAVAVDAMLLLDTTVYIDSVKQSGLPPGVAALISSRIVRHSKLCIGDLAFGLGGLDPAHSQTIQNQSVIASLLEMISDDTVVELSPAGWAKAGALAGTLTRMQGFALDRRRALFIDAAIFVTAQEAGLTLVSGNISDMDLLLQVGGPADIILYTV